MTLGRFVDGLRERGHLVHVYHTADRPKQTGETPLPSIPLPGYKEVRMGLPGRFKLFNQWKKKRPDVVYVATETPLGYSAIQAAQTLGIPVAAGFHTNLKKEGFDEVRLLGRGVDTKLFTPEKRSEDLRREWGAAPDDVVCLYVGRVSTEKNIPVSMEAYRAMREIQPNTEMVIVGDGPERESLAKKFPEVIFAGMQTGEDLAAHYASCDVLLFASETETYGNVVMEALGSGNVTLSYDYAAPKRFVIEGENGYKAPLGDAEAFIEAARNIARNPDQKALKLAARRSAEELSWGRVITSFEANMKNLSLRSINERNVSKKKPHILQYRSIFISDVHLGGEGSKVKEVYVVGMSGRSSTPDSYV